MPTPEELSKFSLKGIKMVFSIILIFFLLALGYVIITIALQSHAKERVTYDISLNDITNNRYSQVDHVLITPNKGDMNMIRDLSEFELNNHFYTQIDSISDSNVIKHYDLYDKDDNVLFIAEEFSDRQVSFYSANNTLIGNYKYALVTDD